LEVKFINQELEELYCTGASLRYKKVPPEVIRKLPRAVEVLIQASIITDLWNFPAYKFERLEGYSNRYSMRLNRTWRLEMQIDWEDATCTVGIVALDDLTPHYGD
jgi:toxin HigB-1